MGYSEVYCHICGMSFNVGRIRRPDEPPAAGWSIMGYSGGFFVCSSLYVRDFCPREAGCLVAIRPLPGRKQDPAEDVTDPADEADGDYEYESSDGEEPYEYEIPEESGGDDDVDMAGEGDDDDDEVSDSTSENNYVEFVRSIRSEREHVGPTFPQHPEIPPETDVDERFSDLGPSQALEHIAGSLGCRFNNSLDCGGGFNGHAISAEDMRGCNTIQCLVRKPEGWVPEPDDKDFEQRGDYFLSGLSDYMPSRDDRSPKVFPHRHGYDMVKAENVMWEPSRLEQYAMPFHPTCLEVFKRASLYRSGRVDMKGLTGWWAQEANYQSFYSFPRDPAVNREQWFRHKLGDDFVAANPCFIRPLQNIISSSVQLGDEAFVHGDFDGTKETTTVSTDTFSRLPESVRILVLLYLQPKDIANLRLASRTFLKLKQSIFRLLILRDMPWLWEVWSELDYSPWTATTSSELQKEAHNRKERSEFLQASIRALLEDESEDSQQNRNDAAISALREQLAVASMEPPRGSVSCPKLSVVMTDWFRLRTELTKQHDQLLGLRNRRRIWKDCNEILDRIARYRDEGKIS
ncbi:hypothetical protein BX600DRAFT_319071 [Xylariales sp. PMI_506]|nr:hypothetical protein BX600DRAFT_319071 [Xylariales sp. PMI_506]